jgi:hypothetical protein
MKTVRGELERAEQALVLHRKITQRGSGVLRHFYRVERIFIRRSSLLGKIADDLSFAEEVEGGLRRVAEAYLRDTSLETLRAEARARSLTRADLELLSAIAEWAEETP